MRRPIVTALFLSACLACSPALAGGEKKKGGGLSFLQLKPLAATIMRADGRRGVLTVEAGIDAKDEALYARAQSSMPRLRAALVTVVQNHAQGMGPGAAPSADRLAADLQRETDRILGRSGGKILLGTLMMN
jgi:hypothetical protein